MIYKKRVVLQPEYVKKFKCVGSQCEDTCCKGWTVTLDKKTYLKYKKLKNYKLRGIISKSIKRIHNQGSDSNYGKIKMDFEGKCPLLDEKKLCKIHSELGEDYLSDTCMFYPRSVSCVDGSFERSLMVSCPEACKLILLNPCGIKFENIEEDANKDILVNRMFNSHRNNFDNKLKEYFWEIRIFSLNLIQNRNYNLEERLIILGIVYKKIEELYNDKKIEELPRLLNNMNSIIESEGLKEKFKNIPISTHIQIRLIKEITNEKVIKGVSNKRYIECLKEAALGLENSNDGTLESVVKKYEYNYKEYFIPYLKDKEYIIENYILNEYFKEMMPFGFYKTIWDSYMFLCILYSMVKLNMIGISGYYKGLNDDITLKIIQSLSKEVVHNVKYIQEIIKLLKDNEYDTLAYMSIIIKN